MSTEKESMDELKKRISVIKTTAGRGLIYRDDAAGCLCEAVVLIAD